MKNNTTKKVNWLEIIAMFIGATGVLIMVYFLILLYKGHYFPNSKFDPNTTSAIGSFWGGVIGSFWTLASVMSKLANY